MFVDFALVFRRRPVPSPPLLLLMGILLYYDYLIVNDPLDSLSIFSIISGMNPIRQARLTYLLLIPIVLYAYEFD